MSEPISHALTERQRRVIPFLLSGASLSESIRQAGISRKTFYEWMKTPDFRNELAHQREQLSREAFETLENSMTKAVQTLTGLLDSEDEKLQRFTANDIIDHVHKYRELRALEERVKDIEAKLTGKTMV